MFKKTYPWLDSPYRNSWNDQKARKDFLAQIDNFVNQKQYVKITLLDWNEMPLKEIEGELTSGSISKTSSSSVRRTCQLQASVNHEEYSIEDANMDFAINKKIYLEVGVKNYTQQYKDYPIIYFPQGLFFIGNFSINSSTTSSINISLQLKDKMATLNGDIGGAFSASTVLDELDTQGPDGEYVTEKVLIYQIIQEMVCHIGGESLNNIVIEDVPLKIKRVVKWTGDNPLWMLPQGNINEQSGYFYQTSVNPPDNTGGWTQYPNGSDVGYVYDDFVYMNELIANPGDTVVTILDKLKSYLGNYEYFYDVFGVFHFREIKNYMNHTQATGALDNMALEDYLTETTIEKSAYTFSDDTNLISISATPQYQNIKNDYIVQGLRKMSGTDVSVMIRYHLAIDQKPRVGNTYRDLLLYKEEKTELVKAQFPLHVTELPKVGNFNIIYYLTMDNTFWFWNEDEYKEVNVVKYYPETTNTEGYVTKDWRTELYLRGMLSRNNGTDASQYYYELIHHHASTGEHYGWLDTLYNTVKNESVDVDFYFEELEAFWPIMYNLETQQWYGEEESDKTLVHLSIVNGTYFLDFIDTTNSGFSQFGVQNIGRRTDAVSAEEYNCLFEPEFPNIIFLNIDAEDYQEQQEEASRNGEAWTGVPGYIYFGFATGGYANSCYEKIKYELYLHTSYQKALSVSAIPNWYLEPNTRVTINDKTTNTYGDFLVTSINLPLGGSGTMAVSASECIERYF